MRLFNAIFALPFIAAVVGTPVPAAEKRALAPSSSIPLDLVSLLGDLKTKIQPTIDLLKAGGGLIPTSTAEGHVTYLKDSFADFESLIGGLSPEEVTGSPEDIAAQVNPMIEELQAAFKNQPGGLGDVPGLGDLVKVLEAEVGGVLITLRNEVPALGDSLADSPDLLGGTLGGILDNLLGGGLSKLGQ